MTENVYSCFHLALFCYRQGSVITEICVQLSPSCSVQRQTGFSDNWNMCTAVSILLCTAPGSVQWWLKQHGIGTITVLFTNVICIPCVAHKRLTQWLSPPLALQSQRCSYCLCPKRNHAFIFTFFIFLHLFVCIIVHVFNIIVIKIDRQTLWYR